MRNPALHLLAFVLVIGGCVSPVAPELRKCPKTFENDSSPLFMGQGAAGRRIPVENYGCARIVVFVTYPARPWPPFSHYHFSVRAAQEGGEQYYISNEVEEGGILVTAVRRREPPPGGGDTLSVRVKGIIMGPRDDTWPNPVFAADSITHVAHFTETSQVPQVDTLYLDLRGS